ncbi:Prolamin-like domain [Macleaya cordata]|uniref:Prolamin-like domain n=1 Tax=Macleaya cordata TaxID=56857 RepID=A0A200QJG0_MACCD|nr:Prolamin-like domain [Macleaya cordata]
MMMLFLACIAVMVAPGLGLEENDAAAEAPSINEGLPPEPSQGFYDYLDNCTANVPAECGLEIVAALLKTEDVSYDCCENLIEMGKDCHDALVETIGTIDTFKSLASELPQRGSEVWNYCANLATAPSPSNY